MTLSNLPATVRRWSPPQTKASLRTRLPVPLAVTRTVTACVVRLEVAELSSMAHTPTWSIPGSNLLTIRLGDGLTRQLVRTALRLLLPLLARLVSRLSGRQALCANIRAEADPKRPQSSLIRRTLLSVNCATSLVVRLVVLRQPGPLSTRRQLLVVASFLTPPIVLVIPWFIGQTRTPLWFIPGLHLVIILPRRWTIPVPNLLYRSSPEVNIIMVIPPILCPIVKGDLMSSLVFRKPSSTWRNWCLQGSTPLTVLRVPRSPEDVITPTVEATPSALRTEPTSFPILPSDVTGPTSQTAWLSW